MPNIWNQDQTIISNVGFNMFLCKFKNGRIKSFIPVGLWKLNCDATWNDDKQRGGVGWILRDWTGLPLMAGYRCINRRWRIPWLEAFAISEGLRACPSTSSSMVGVEKKNTACSRNHQISYGNRKWRRGREERFIKIKDEGK